MEQIRQQVSFERGVQQQPVKRSVFAKRSNQLPAHVLEQAAIVAALGQFIHLHKPSVAAHGGFLFVQNRVIKILLAGEVAEQDGLADARRGGDVLGLGAAEAVAGEAFDRYPQQLPAAVLAGHTGACRRGMGIWAAPTGELGTAASVGLSGRAGTGPASISKYSLLSTKP